jgi:hypothetical protein
MKTAYRRIAALTLAWLCLFHARAQGMPPQFHFTAFHNGEDDLSHISFVREANKWFPQIAMQYAVAQEGAVLIRGESGVVSRFQRKRVTRLRNAARGLQGNPGDASTGRWLPQRWQWTGGPTIGASRRGESPT